MKKTERRKPPKKEDVGLIQKRDRRDHVAPAHRRPAEQMRMVTLHVSIPSSLVEQAKKKTGIRSDLMLVETALARLIGEEGYVGWLLAKGTGVSQLVGIEREERELALLPTVDRSVVQQRRIVIRSRGGSMPGIHSKRAILLEGNADDIVPNGELGTGMHGFVIMVPPGEEGERLLDMLWRITMAYAGRPSMLRSRTTVRKMVEAVWSKESREPSPTHRPARKSGQANRAQRDDLASLKLSPDPAAEPNAKSRKATKPLPPLRDENKAQLRK